VPDVTIDQPVKAIEVDLLNLLEEALLSIRRELVVEREQVFLAMGSQSCANSVQAIH